MNSVLSGRKIAVLGGDARELILIEQLLKMGAVPDVAGFPVNMTPTGAHCSSTVEGACENAEAVILPLSGTSTHGHIKAVYYPGKLVLTETAIQKITSKAIVIVGSARPFLREWSEKFNFILLEINENDELAILNSVPTAEGAIQIAMEETEITISGSKCCVLGLGRVGMTLARLLKALGAEVAVISKEKSELARASEMGCRQSEFNDLIDLLGRADMVFNTIPALVLNEAVLRKARPEILIIDIASQPGGTDFEAAGALGIKAILAPGLPGKVAPVSAGKILAAIVPRLLLKTLEEAGNNLTLGGEEV
ncbi:MAG: dipicolinate synthase subunit DpsA [Syntrophomonadaceae bacterium]|nr:dipicolinate synthase subunit DpsA [Syntrophomonadaceae bacterium]